MRLLLAPDDLTDRLPLGSTLDLAGLATLYAPPAQTPTWLRVNMVATLDGAAQGSDGRSGTINTPADHIVFELLRALSDVVVVGAGTARVEGYTPLRVLGRYAALRAAHGRPAALPLAVVTRDGQLPDSLMVDGASDRTPVLVLTCRACPRLGRLRGALGEQRVIVAGDDSVALPEAVDALHAHGLRAILCEGGPQLLGRMSAAELIDELDLTLAPRVVGGERRRIVAGPARDDSFTLATLVTAQDTLIGRWLRRR